MEHGLHHVVNGRMYTPKPICHSNGQNFDSVRLTDCLVAVIILAYGCLLSIVILLLEKFFYSKNISVCLN